jgi:GNAT superfamily N-acetyltransferase
MHCVASLYVNNKSDRLRKFATLQTYQGKGIGSFMLNYLIDKLNVLDIDYFWFDARESAVEFYCKFGFNTQGHRFYKNNVAYFKMYMSL